jgi:hypothetical protein
LRSEGNFKYSTTIATPPQGVDRADWFLFQAKEGYCEYYATAMIVMLRHLGIPTRMATGYAPGNYEGKDTFVVKESMAHTWPEVYFPGYGWVEFEPTPSQTVVSRPQVPGEPTEEPTVDASISPTPPAIRNTNEHNYDDQTIREPLTGLGSQGGEFPMVAVVIAVLAVLLVALARVVPISPWAAKRGRLETAGHYYGRMLRWARLLGLGPAVYQTPYEFGDTVAREIPGTSLFARTITRAYVYERFSRGGDEPSDRAAVNRAWESLRGKFWRAVPARQIRRAYRRRRMRPQK